MATAGSRCASGIGRFRADVLVRPLCAARQQGRPAGVLFQRSLEQTGLVEHMFEPSPSARDVW